MSDGISVTSGTSPRITPSTLGIKFHTTRAVTRIVPIRARKAALLSVMLGVWTLGAPSTSVRTSLLLGNQLGENPAAPLLTNDCIELLERSIKFRLQDRVGCRQTLHHTLRPSEIMLFAFVVPVRR